MSDTPQFFSLSNGEEVPLVLESRRGLRNITIRPKTLPRREIHISIPRFVRVSTAMKFLEQKRKWVEKIYADSPAKVKLCEGDALVVFGRELIACQVDFGGAPEFLERRVRDYIKKEFLAAVKAQIREFSPEFRPKKIAIHDTTSRWGSCSSTGTVSLSWRLAFAPPEVMRYVICHECAHMLHMDHSPEFWAECARLYGRPVSRAKLWLTRNGAQLHRYL